MCAAKLVCKLASASGTESLSFCLFFMQFSRCTPFALDDPDVLNFDEQFVNRRNIEIPLIDADLGTERPSRSQHDIGSHRRSALD